VCIVTVQPQKALVSYQRLVTLYPKSFVGYIGVASANSMLGKTTAALGDVEKARALGAPELNCVLVQLDCYHRLKLPDKAIAVCSH
ncbi:hypothetical protein ABTG69_20030, partial [Acinetobacter baumannii]